MSLRVHSPSIEPPRLHERLPGVRHAPCPSPEGERVLTPPALAFVATLERRFRNRRSELLAGRERAWRRLAEGELPSFPAETRELRAEAWTVAPVPPELKDRRVEITGPVDPKLIVNGLNSGASVFMADFEDATSPTWKNVVSGQAFLADAVRHTLQHHDPATGKTYTLNPFPALLFVRPRGWHLEEKHLRVDGRAVSASLFDFGLFLFHNARELLARGSGPYFYLPKLENRFEARLWNDVFEAASSELALPARAIKATVLIETVPAAFEMDEILWELRDHAAGLNCGRWDYLFSFIKTFQTRPDCVLPDRECLDMERRFLRSYSRLLVQTCHRRGTHAMGGMAAWIPDRRDPERNAEALRQVRRDKRREVLDGHDGTWVAHPDLVGVAREVFDTFMPDDNQIHRARPEADVGARDLLSVPRGPLTLDGLRGNLRVAQLYLAAWLRGRGCIPVDGRMEDAATAEIARAQVWQWLRHRPRLERGDRVNLALVRREHGRLLRELRRSLGPRRFTQERHPEASEILLSLFEDPCLEPFLTSVAYPELP